MVPFLFGICGFFLSVQGIAAPATLGFAAKVHFKMIAESFRDYNNSEVIESIVRLKLPAKYLLKTTNCEFEITFTLKPNEEWTPLLHSKVVKNTKSDCEKHFL